jgi:HAD superfamily hydrolase (TIGR01509 family)
MTIRFVCFDIGGVLVRHCRSFAEGCRAAGLPQRDGCDTPEIAAARKLLAHQLTTGAISEPEFYRGMSQTTAGLYTPEEIRQIHHAWLGVEYDGVYPVVERLVGSGIKTGILSNTNPAHWERLSNPVEYPTIDLIPNRHASHLLRLAKPDPAIFRAYQDLVGARPGEILFLEDLPDNIAAAHAAGWTVEPIDHTQDTASQLLRIFQSHSLLSDR